MWDANNWYAAGLGGNFMKTTNGGSTWNFSDFVGGFSSTGIYNTIYDGHFFDLNNGFLCGGSGKVYKTTNAGASWDSTTAIASGVTWYDMHWINSTTGFLSGTTSGRVAMTTDGGNSWAMMGTIPTGTYYNVYAKDANNVITTTTGGNIRKTTDGGTTWSTISTGASATLYRIHFLDANTGYVSGTSTAIRYTTDFGDTWTSTNTGVASSTFYDIDFSSGSLPSPTLNQLFTDVTFPPTGWTSSNSTGSEVWERSTSEFVSSPASAYISYQGTYGSDWLVTTQNSVFAGDSLVFWLARDYTGGFFTYDSLDVGISTTSQDTSTFTSIIRLGCNISDTSGSTYPPRLGNVFQRYAVDLSSYAGQNVYVGFRHSNENGIGVYLDDVSVGLSRPASQDYVYITGNSFNIYKSAVGVDAFDTVQFLDPTQPWTSTFYATDLSSTGDTVLTAGASGLINARFSPGNRVTFTQYVKAGTLYDIWAENSSGRVIAVGAPGIAGSVYDQVMYSTNGGANWQIGNYSASDDQDLNSLDMINNTTGYVAGDEGIVSKTTDGGATWTQTGTDPSSTELNKVVFIDVNTGYVFGASGQGHKTTDGGATWSTLTTGMGTSVINGAHFVDANTGWVVGASGKVFKTTDGGATFNSQDAKTTSTLYSVFMIDANTGWIGALTGNVRRTTDGGANWDSINVPHTSAIYSVFFTDANNGIGSGSSGRIYRTRDGGTTWEFGNTGGSTLWDVHMTSTDTAFIAGLNAAIFKYQETLTGSGTFTNSVPERYFLDQNYPNPFNPTTTIKFGLPKEGLVSLKIYDIAGRQIANLINNERMNAGIVTQNFNGSSLASGVYFYSLSVDNNLIATKKMVLVK